MDKILGDDHLINDIVWKRTSAHTGEGKITSFGTIHDDILFFTKSDKYTFNPQYSAYDKRYIKDFYRNKDSNGRLWTSSDLMAAGVRHGESGKPWHGIDPAERGNHWKFTVTRLDELAKEGRIYFPLKSGGVPRYKRYLDEMPGILLQDIWMDIPPVSAHSAERLGYPTQKPEALLERIINTSSNPTDIVLDPFCGCGTATAVAHKLGRRWVGIDISPTACKLIAKRMHSISGQVIEVFDLPRTLPEVKKLEHFEFQNWVLDMLNGRRNPKLTGDFGVDGYLMDGTPVQVKQMEDVGRVPIDEFETALQRKGKDKGMFVAFSFGSGAVEEVGRAKNEQNLEIILRKVEDIINER